MHIPNFMNFYAIFLNNTRQKLFAAERQTDKRQSDRWTDSMASNHLSEIVKVFRIPLNVEFDKKLTVKTFYSVKILKVMKNGLL